MTWLYVDRELADHQYICSGCDSLIDMDEAPSPAEIERVCADCVDLHGPHGDCHCCEREAS